MKTKIFRSTVLPLIILALLLFGQVETASAVKPDRDPLPAGDFVLSGVCNFDVNIEFLTNKEYLTSFYNQDGDLRMMLTTGALKVQLTNLSTGTTLAVNIPGPGRIYPHEDNAQTWITTGNWLWFLQPGVLPDFQPRFFHMSGKLITEFDSSGNLVNMTVAGGRVIDMCAELSS